MSGLSDTAHRLFGRRGGKHRHFHEELERLELDILGMGELAERSLQRAVQALMDRDHALAQAVLGALHRGAVGLGRLFDGGEGQAVAIVQAEEGEGEVVGPFGEHDIAWFNGGLFADTDVIPLTLAEAAALAQICKYDWASIEPSVFGTLFERILDPDKRSQIGAHYTSREDIETLLVPVVLAPLRREGKGSLPRLTVWT